MLRAVKGMVAAKSCEKGLMFRIRKLRVFGDIKILDMLAIFEGQKGRSQYEPCFVWKYIFIKHT